MAHHPEPESSSESHEAHVSLTTYLIIFAALMILLVVTVAAAFIPTLPFALNTVIAMSIAVIKATLVVLYFMHVKHSSRLTKVFVVSSFLWLGILFMLTFADYFTRWQLPMSKGWVEETHQGPLTPNLATMPPAHPQE